MLEGNLDELVDALITHYQAERLKEFNMDAGKKVAVR
jgi:protein subunit release factor A